MVNSRLVGFWVFLFLFLGLIGIAGCEERQDPHSLRAQLEENLLLKESLPDDPQLAELVKAAGKGDIKKINQLVEAGVDPNGSPSPDGFTPLGWATHKNNKEAMKRLLDLGADPNKPFAISSLLFGYCRDCEPMDVVKDTEALELLLQSGANPNGNGGHKNPLLDNISDIEKIKLLIDYGADVNKPSPGYIKDIQVLENGEKVDLGIIRTYPLSMAIAPRSLEVAHLLLDHGANTDLDSAYTHLKNLMKRNLDPEQRKLGLELEHRIYERGGRYYPPFRDEEWHIRGLRFYDKSRMVDLKPGEPVPDFN